MTYTCAVGAIPLIVMTVGICAENDNGLETVGINRVAAAGVLFLYGQISNCVGILWKGGFFSSLISLERGGLAWLHGKWGLVLVFSFLLSNHL